MTFLHPEWLILLLLPVLASGFLFKGWVYRKSMRQAFCGPAPALGRLGGIGFSSLLLGLLLAVLAMLRPVSDPEEQDVTLRGRNIIFLVDVSRSMLAADLVPHRLDRARFDIQSALPVLRGHRVALVAFAGDAVLKCPLTTDYAFFSQALADLSVSSVSRGGSSIGDALRFIINDLLPPEEEAVDIILITDGEDQETYPVEAAYKAGDRGIRIIAVGMGEEGRDTPIPDVTYQDEIVLSRPDMQLLKEIAAASHKGWMVSVSEGALDAAGLIRALEGDSQDTGTFRRILYKEHYRLFLLPGFFLILFGLYYRRRYGF